MVRKFVILGLSLVLVGTVAIQWVLAQKRKEQKQAAYYKSKHDSEMSEHLRQYKKWLSLPVQERTELPLGLDQYVKSKTTAQLLQEQKERLTADLEKLAAGEIDPYPYADILYGKNWQEQLSEYKKRRELREAMLTSSIACTSVGGVIIIGCLLICTARPTIRRVPRLRRLFANGFRYRRKAEDKNLPEADIEIDEDNSQIPLTYLLDLRDAPQRPTATESLNASTIQIEGSLKSQVENLEKQVEQIRQMTSPVRNSTIEDMGQKKIVSDGLQQAIVEHSGPLNDTLVELAQQVAAIREYASGQQDRVKKLQDGYDLNIIKNFCIRIIRCIDNLESCISGQSEQNSETMHLKEVRDELLFALESSGVEQFEPEINSDYRGQERHAEAVKEKECCNDPDLTGKIAKVIKPGYQYFIDEDSVKVIRPAMVKLFG